MTERKIATKSTTKLCIPGTVRTEAAVESGSSGECDATLIGNRFMITSQQCSHWTVSGVGTSKFTPNDSDEELKVQFIDRTYYYSDAQTTPSTTDFQYAVLDLNAKVGSSTSGPCNTDLSTCSNAFCSDDHAIVVSVPESTADDAAGIVTCLELQQAISDGVGLGCDDNTNDAAALEQVIETVCRCEIMTPPRPAMQQIPPPMPGSIFSSVAPTSTPAHTRKPPQKSNFQASSSQGGQKKMPNGALVGIIVTVVLLVFTLGLGFYYFVWKGGKKQQHRKLRRTDSVAAIEIKGSSEETDRTSDDTTSTDEVELKKDDDHSLI